MWSETVGLRTRPVSDQKIGLVLVLQVWCVAKHGIVTLVVIVKLFILFLLCCLFSFAGEKKIIIITLKDTTTSQVLFLVSQFSAWNITTVETNCGVYLLKN